MRYIFGVREEELIMSIVHIDWYWYWLQKPAKAQIDTNGHPSSLLVRSPLFYSVHASFESPYGKSSSTEKLKNLCGQAYSNFNLLGCLSEQGFTPRHKVSKNPFLIPYNFQILILLEVLVKSWRGIYGELFYNTCYKCVSITELQKYYTLLVV